MERFTKEQMRGELREILLYQADHIDCCGVSDAAEAFIGFPPEADEGDYERYWRMDSSNVDLNRFPISRNFDKAYDFAFHPSLIHSISTGEIADLVTFMNGTPRIITQDVDHIDPLLRTRPTSVSFMSQDGYCQTVVDAAAARWKLEISGKGTFSPRELALLANMSEGAVRNAMSDKSDAGLKTLPGLKPIQVEHEEAWRWIQGRRGFKAIPKRASDDIIVKEKLSAVRSAGELGHLIRSQRISFLERHDFEQSYFNIFLEEGEESYFNIDRQSSGSSLANWSREDFELWENGSFAFDFSKATQLAEGLEFDIPLFVGKALEVSLRRDAQEGDRP